MRSSIICLLTLTFFTLHLSIAEQESELSRESRETNDDTEEKEVGRVTTKIDSGVHFRSMGQVVGSLNYVHLVIDFDLKKLGNDLEMFCNTTGEFANQMFDDLRVTENFMHTFRSSRANLHQQCQELKNEFSNSRRIWVNPSKSNQKRATATSMAEGIEKAVAHLTREKRQVLVATAFVIMGIVALGSYLYTHSQLVSLSLAAGPNSATVKVLQDHELRLTVNERSLRLLRTAQQAMVTKLESTGSDVAAMEGLFAASLAFETAEQEYKRIILGLERLSQHRLSPSLVNTFQFAKTLHRLKRVTESRGLTFAIRNLEEVYRCDTSHLVFANQTVRVLIHIPAWRDRTLLSLHEYVAVPLALPGTDGVKYILPRPNRKILATSEARNLFRELEKDDLTMCKTILGTYFCPNENMYDRRTESSCLVALFRGNVEHIVQACPFDTMPERDFLVQLNSNEFVLYHNVSKRLDQACGGNRIAHLVDSVVGLARVNVPAGCRVTTDSFIFEGSESTVTDPIAIDFQVIDLTQAVSLDDSDIFFQISKDLKLVGSSEGLKIRDLVTEFARQRTVRVWSLGITGGLILLAALVLCIIVLRCRMFKKRCQQRKRYREVDNASSANERRREYDMSMARLAAKEENAKNPNHLIGSTNTITTTADVNSQPP